MYDLTSLIPITFMGTELVIPHWLFLCVLLAVGLFLINFAGRLFESFCFLKVLKDKKED